MRFSWLNKESREFLRRGYIEGNAEDRVVEIATVAEDRLGMEGFADKFVEYMSNGWYSLASPIWTNYGLPKGMPISCFGSFVNDSVDSMVYTGAEIAMMSKYGGGTSAYLGKIRHRGSPISTGGKADGPVHYALHYDTIVDIFKQSDTRRGSCAIYLDIEHEDIFEFLEIKKEGHPIQNLQFAVCVGDDWMQDMVDGDKKKRKVWAKVIQRRIETGFPYIFFKDNANNNKPSCLVNHPIYASNLCSEIMLPSNDSMSFVCCLSSMNLLYYDDWKDTDAVETLIYFLDTVITEFIEKSERAPFMERPNRFAKSYRALGMGVLGWHSYLQSKMIPFEGLHSKMLNVQIFKNISDKASTATKKLATLFGEPEALLGHGVRNATTMAVAPTKSSSFILGQVSMGIEPIKSNYFIKDLAKSKTVYKNPYLEKLLDEKGKNYKYVWDDIMKNNGSIQHLDYFTKEEKEVFKTFIEISPMEIVQQAAARQKYIDQGQSLNLTIHPSISARKINELYIEAWRLGLKSLYYQFSENAAQSFARDITNCTACEG